MLFVYEEKRRPGNNDNHLLVHVYICVRNDDSHTVSPIIESTAEFYFLKIIITTKSSKKVFESFTGVFDVLS